MTRCRQHQLPFFSARRALVSAGLALCAAAVLSAQTPPSALGDPRWMPVDRIQGGRSADAVAMERGLLALLDTVKAVAPLNPPPGVYPRATLSFTPVDAGQPHRGDMMLGFWPPHMTTVRAGRLDSAGELSHLIVYVNWVRTESMDRTFWKDGKGAVLPQPRVLGDVQGFPVYEGFGSVETSGILVILPKGRSLFEPVSRDRFHALEVADLERQIAEAAPALKAAQDKYAAFISPSGRLAQEQRITNSLAQYEKARPRTPEQMAYRAQELKRLEGEEEARLQTDALPATHRLIGPLTTRLNAASAARAALTATERSQQACHVPDSRISGPHPAPLGTAGCQPVVAVASWNEPAQPANNWRVISIERYWSSSEDVRRGVDRARAPWSYINKAVVEAIDWQTVASTMLK